MACPDKVSLNKAGECVVNQKSTLNVYASDFLLSRPSLAELKYKRTKWDIRLGVDNRDKIGCAEGVSLEDCDFYTRHIVSAEGSYSVIRESKELAYPGAVIVVETNQVVVDNFKSDTSTFKQVVTRYWYDTDVHEVRFEELFTLEMQAQFLFFSDILVFDGFAVFIGSSDLPPCPSIVSATF